MVVCHIQLIPSFSQRFYISNDFDGVIAEFDRILGKDQIAVFHINDSKNERGVSKDRHENIGRGKIGFKALYNIVHHPDFEDIPKILETPYLDSPDGEPRAIPPYKEEIAMFREPVDSKQ